MLIEGRGAGEHGVGSASGAAQRNTCMLKRERASAIIFSLPGMCCAVAEKLNLAAQRKSCLRSCIILGHLDVPEHITLATASLSQTNEMRLFDHRCPQVAAASTIGNSSFHWMLLLI